MISCRKYYKLLALGLLLMLCLPALAQTQTSAPVNIYPTNWWTGMHDPHLQLMLRGTDIARSASVKIVYPGVTVKKITPASNLNYLFIDLDISSAARPGEMPISIKYGAGAGSDRKPIVINYPLLSRQAGKGTRFARGVNSADLIYFLMPDRFSNGDTSNDRIAGMRDQSLNRDSIFLRHGGDMQGVLNHLDYLQGLGVTTLWMTPVLENDMPNRTEHGYAFTDHYRIEPRLGGAAAYRKLSDELHRRGMKLIQDAVYNHVGLFHFLKQDPPAADWFHQWPEYTQTSFKDQPLMDPYASSIDKKIVSDGWFTREMPDLNQGNPYVAQYLIQHAIWCVETFGVDGWRIDTYIYNDLEFMNRCNKALMDEYPHISLFGETWVHGTANQAYFAQNNLQIPYKSNLPGVTDFQCNFSGIVPALTESFGWTDGVNKLYSTLSNDFLYKDPMRNVIFLDNHDMSRFFSQVKEDTAKQKIGIGWLLTCRGIPQLYYGTEILMKGFSNPDGWVRLDFPGGWPGDKKNAFTGEGMSAAELSIQAFTRKLAMFRKSSSAIGTGKMMQYVPKDGLYTYFRYDEKQTIMCVMNTDTSPKTVSFSQYAERTTGFRQAADILSGQVYSTGLELTIPAMTMYILELKK